LSCWASSYKEVGEYKKAVADCIKIYFSGKLNKKHTGILFKNVLVWNCYWNDFLYFLVTLPKRFDISVENDFFYIVLLYIW
jgi:hypothetical protein